MSEKSSTFVTSLKTISVLLIICLVCGALLALCNDLLYIDEETKFNRAMQKVYPQFDRDTTFSETPVADHKTLAGVGSVSKVYLSKDGTYILEATGLGGWDNGNVTMYIAVGGETPNVAIKALTVTGNVGQSYMSKVDQKSIDNAYVGKKLQDVAALQFGADYKLGGTTYTSTAIMNCVKAAVNYCVVALQLVSTPESEARDAAVALLGNDYAFTTVVNESYTTALGANFYFTATKDGVPALDVYVFGDKATGHQIVALNSTLLHADRNSDTAVVAKSEGIDNALVTKVQGLSLLEHQVQQYAPNFTYDADGDLGDLATNADFPTAEITKVYKSNSGALAMEVRAPGYGGTETGPYLTILVIVADDKIAGWDLISEGNNNFFAGAYMADEEGKQLAGKDRVYVGSSISNIIESQSPTGATAPYSGNALYEIVNLAAYYARSINQ